MLDEWHPPAFADADVPGHLRDACTRLERIRLAVVEDRLAVDLELGGGADLIPELELLAAQHPFRERLVGYWMTALYRAGRQVEALAAYRETRRRLVDELGLEPGPELRAVEQRILAQTDASADPTTVAGPLGETRRAESRHGNLPHAVDSFVGRSSDVDEIQGLLAEHRLVTLAGPGGTGKTRLATEACRGIADRFPDGMWFVDLALVAESDLVAAAMAETWRLRSGELAVDDLVIDHLRERDTVLVVDNCEHVIGAVAALVRRLLQETRAVRVLATSREPLAVSGERVVRVPSLEVMSADGGPGPAVELFVERGRSARTGWEPTAVELDDVRAICERLDGIPLAVELVAARVRSMSPAELLDRFDGSALALVGAHHPAVQRHRTLAATIEWSYQLLKGMECDVLQRMAVFTGGFDLAAALAVCDDMGRTVTDLVDAVDALVDRSLILAAHHTTGTRYRLLEPVRQWLVAHAGGTESVRLRHARHYADLVATLAPDLRGHGQREAFRRIEVELPNLRTAFDTLADRADLDTYLDMAFELYMYWAHRGPYLDGFEISTRGLDLAARVGTDLERQVKVAFVATMCAGWMRRRIASDEAERCRSLAERLGDPRAMGWAAIVRAMVVVNADGSQTTTPDEAISLMFEARARFEAATAEPAWWESEWERAFLLMLFVAFMPPTAERIAEFEESERILSALGDEALLVTLYSQVNSLVDVMGRERVIALLARGAESSVSPQWANTCRARLAFHHQQAAEHDLAVPHLRIAFDESVQRGDSARAVRGRSLAISLCAIGSVDEARQVMTTVFEASGPQFGERELPRSFAVAAAILAADGHDELAALALGASRGEDDGHPEVLRAVAGQLADRLGDVEFVRCSSVGAALDLGSLTERVRTVLAG